MSCAETEQAVLDRIKTETRRLGWWEDKNGRRLVNPGDHLTLVRKSMGRKRQDGTVEPLVVLAEVEVTSVHREPLNAITEAAVDAEGVDPAKYVPWRTSTSVPRPLAWALWFASTMKCPITADVTVIRWRYLDDVAGQSAKGLERLSCCGTRRPRPWVVHVCAMPTPPRGFAACRTHDGTQTLFASGATRQITHLVQLDEAGSNGGRPTVCGLTRFDARDMAGQFTSRADLPGWSMGGGVSGPGVQQVRCSRCWPAE